MGILMPFCVVILVRSSFK